MRIEYAIALFYILYFFLIYVLFSAVCICRNKYLYIIYVAYLKANFHLPSTTLYDLLAFTLAQVKSVKQYKHNITCQVRAQLLTDVFPFVSVVGHWIYAHVVCVHWNSNVHKLIKRVAKAT